MLLVPSIIKNHQAPYGFYDFVIGFIRVKVGLKLTYLYS